MGADGWIDVEGSIIIDGSVVWDGFTISVGCWDSEGLLEMDGLSDFVGRLNTEGWSVFEVGFCMGLPDGWDEALGCCCVDVGRLDGDGEGSIDGAVLG